MDSEIRLKRHALLWNAGCNSVRQTAVSALVLAAVLLSTVLEPNATITSSEAELEQKKTLLANDEQELQGLQETQQALLANRADLEEDLQHSEALLGRLGDIDDIIKAVPWDKHNRDLQAMFRNQPSFDYQAEADKTVRKIAAQIETDVVEPFRSALAGIEVDSELAAYPGRIEAAIGQWRDGLIDQQWWLRVDSKERAVLEVTVEVSGLQAEALAKLDEGRAVVEEQRDGILASQAALSVEIALAAKIQKTKKDEIDKAREVIDKKWQVLDEALASALPGWAQKLVNVDAMVRFYPWILIGIAFFLVFRALIATQHYQGMADAEGWTMDERSDPLLSSIWTLTWRRNIGTGATLGTYWAILLCLWYLVSQSVALSPSNDIPSWIPHVFMALAAITATIAPFRYRGHA